MKVFKKSADGDKRLKAYQKTLDAIQGYEEELKLSSDEELKALAQELRERARGEEKLDNLLPQTFALVREACERTLSMRPFDVQMAGGIVLHSGAIAEMKTGEGKTLTAAAPVVLNAFEGKGVHVVTVNDYLAERDGQEMSKVYNFLGLTVGILQTGQTLEEKQAAYACDITYGTNSEIAFDYLRDNMVVRLEDRAQNLRESGPHHFALVDEVDNILIDEARTPLIISVEGEKVEDAVYHRFTELAKTLELGKTPEGIPSYERKAYVADFDYEVDEKQLTVSITERGVAKAEAFLGIEHLYKSDSGHLVNHLTQALRAQSLFFKGKDYLVVDGQVQIVDEHTGRILEGRRWNEGLHQAIESKEGVAIQAENTTQATVTYQNFFRLYSKLSGMTGTAMTEANELFRIYNLQVQAIPPHRPMIRKDNSDLIFKTQEAKWAHVVQEVGERSRRGQPVLVGTASVESSELLSQLLRETGLNHQVLSAKPEYVVRESEMVALAGFPGAVTVATNMAGRGVDIKLGGTVELLTGSKLKHEGLEPGSGAHGARLAQLIPLAQEAVDSNRAQVEAAGGLYVLGTERHESRRIDDQLRGRSGRQGDPGESRFFLSSQDELVRLFAGDRIFKIMDKLKVVDEKTGQEKPIDSPMISKQIRKAQEKVEETNFLQRKRVLEYDDVLSEQRRVIYSWRDSILKGEELVTLEQEWQAMVESFVAASTNDLDEVDNGELLERMEEIFPVSDQLWDRIETTLMSGDELTELLLADLMEARGEVLDDWGGELGQQVERLALLNIIDHHWAAHLSDMDYLRTSMGSRGVMSTVDPIVIYKNEAFHLFGQLVGDIWRDLAQSLFHIELITPSSPPAVVGKTEEATASPQEQPLASED